MKKIANNIQYIDKETDVVESNIQEVRSSISYTLSSSNMDLTLNAPLDYEIKIINGENFFVYGYPDKWEYDYIQGNGCDTNNNIIPNIYYNIPGETQQHAIYANCGIVSCLNILIAAGIYEGTETQIALDAQNINIIDYDVIEHEFVQDIINRNLCDIDPNSPTFGGTSREQIMEILSHYGNINSNAYLYYTSHLEIAQSIKDGKAVILNINSARLSNLSKIDDNAFSFSNSNVNHSIVVTGVIYNTNNELAGFYICNTNGDTGRDQQTLFLSVEQFNWIRSVLGGATIITDPIKNWNKNINGTGNELNNTIKGTSGNNILKGESGADTLYGKVGNDILIGDSSSHTVQELENLKNNNQEVNIVYFESVNDGNDYLDGGKGDDLLIGGGGSDILIGGEDKDSLYGGSGNDLLIAGDSTKTVGELQNILNNSSNISASDYESDTKENTLYGGIGNDILIGDKGNDTLYGGGDDDIIYGGKGDDVIYGDDQNKVYQGNDVLYGGEGSDTLYGGKGDDLLIAGSTSLSAESIKNLATSGNLDTDAFITSQKKENLLHGGEGNDTITDYCGDENYIFNLGDGQDVVQDTYGADILHFDEGISWSDLTFEQSGTNMVIKISNTSDQITVKDWFLSSGTYKSNNKIERFEFADGSVHTKNEISIDNKDKFHFVGTVGNDFLYGTFMDDVYQGNAGNDNIIDLKGGDDTYIYNLGDGKDWITDQGGVDTIKFGAGITADIMHFDNVNGNLCIWFDGKNGTVDVKDYFNNENNKIEKIELADGTVITDIDARCKSISADGDIELTEGMTYGGLLGEGDYSIIGTSGNETFEGNSGNNYIEGRGGNDIYIGHTGNDTYISGSGNDVFIYNLGDGEDYISESGGNDTVVFGEGITRANTRFVNHDGSLSVRIAEGDVFGEVFVDNYFENDASKVENFVFSDGTTVSNVNEALFGLSSEINDITLTDGLIEACLCGNANLNATGNALDNEMNGNAGNNIMAGGLGNDSFWDEQGGNDTYIYNLGDGYDFIHDENGSDTIQFGQGISAADLSFVHPTDSNNLEVLIGESGKITIENYFLGDVYKIETFKFADNSVLTDISSLITEINYSQTQSIVDETEALGEFDVNQLIQEINSYGVDNDVVMTNSQNQNEDLLLVMGN